MVNIRKFLQAIGLIPVSSTQIDSKGELEVLDSSGKLNYHNGTSASPVVTEAHSATLTNKTISGASNTITNIPTSALPTGIDAANIADGSVSNTEFQYLNSVTSDIQTQLNAKASTTDLNNHINDATDAHDASAISNVPAGSIAATDVQAAVNELDGDIQGHITDATDAHDASAISNVPSGNLAATEVQAALNELQSDIDTRATSSALTTHTGASSGVHGVTGSVVGTSDSQTLTNKTLTSPTINTPTVDVLNWDDQTTPANPSAGFYKTYFKNDGKFYKLNSAGLEQEVGSSGPGFTAQLNLMLLNTAANNWTADKTDNFNAETTVGDWVAYADAAATTPVDMTGGSPNTTVTRDTTNEINGTASFKMTVSSGATRQGEGVSCLVNIPTAYRGQALTLSFPYVTSGTISASDFVPYAYDVTNSVLIAPTIISGFNGSTGRVTCTLVTNTSTAQIRVGVHIARASNTGAVDVYFDDVVVGPDISQANLPMSDWIEFTPTITGLGTVSSSKHFWRRVGDTIHVHGSFLAGTVSASTTSITLPAGFTIDGSKLNTASGGFKLGEFEGAIGSTNGFNGSSALIGIIFFDGSTTNIVYITGQGTSTAFQKVNGSSSFNTGQLFSYQYVFPASGLSSGGGTSPILSLSDWQSYTPTGSWVTNTTYTGKYRRVGDSVHIMAHVATAGAPTATQLTISIPSGLVIDTSKLNTVDSNVSPLVGEGQAFDAGVASYPCQAAVSTGASPTTVALRTASGNLSSTNPFTFGSGDYVSVFFSVPILGWTSTSSGTLTAPRSYVRVQAGNGHGSTNTKIRRFSTIVANVGPAITYADSSTAGASFTINEPGIYSMNYSDNYSAGSAGVGFSLNSNQLTTSIGSITASMILNQWAVGTSYGNTGGYTGYFSAGDIIRPHTNGNPDTTDAGSSIFSITKVSN